MNILKTIHAQLPLAEGAFVTMYTDTHQEDDYAGSEFNPQEHAWGYWNITRFGADDERLVENFWAFILAQEGSHPCFIELREGGFGTTTLVCTFDQCGTDLEMLMLGAAHFYQEGGDIHLWTAPEEDHGGGWSVDFSMPVSEMAATLREMYSETFSRGHLYTDEV